MRIHVLANAQYIYYQDMVLLLLQDFGAVGDGVADDTQAFLDAVDAIGRQGTVYVPAGRYIITQQINIPNRVVIKGGLLALLSCSSCHDLIVSPAVWALYWQGKAT